MDAHELGVKNIDELKELAKHAGIKGYSKMKKQELIAVMTDVAHVKDGTTGPVTALDVVEKPKRAKKAAAEPTKRKPRAAKHQEHTAESLSPESKRLIEDTIKKVSKQQLLPHAESLNILTPAKYTKKDLIDMIVEKTVAIKLGEILETKEEPALPPM